MNRSRVLLLALSASALFVWGFALQRNDEPSGWKQLDQFLVDNEVNGAVIGVAKDGAIAIKAIGTDARGRRLRPDLVFPLASLSKVLTSSVIRDLARSGKLDLDGLLVDYLPDMKWGDAQASEITIRQLLQHSAGFERDDRLGDPFFAGSMPVGCKKAISSALMRPLKAPGSAIAYSNVGYCFLGEVVEQVENRAYEDAVRDIVGIGADQLFLGPPIGLDYEPGKLETGAWVDAGAAGGWFASAETFVRFAASDAQDPMICAQAPAPFYRYYYGLGWRIWPVQGECTELTHYGALPGMFSFVLAYPDGRAAVVLSNDRPANDEAAAIQLKLALEALLKEGRN